MSGIFPAWRGKLASGLELLGANDHLALGSELVAGEDLFGLERRDLDQRNAQGSDGTKDTNHRSRSWPWPGLILEPTGTSTKITFALLARRITVDASCSERCRSWEFWRNLLAFQILGLNQRQKKAWSGCRSSD